MSLELSTLNGPFAAFANLPVQPCACLAVGEPAFYRLTNTNFEQVDVCGLVLLILYSMVKSSNSSRSIFAFSSISLLSILLTDKIGESFGYR